MQITFYIETKTRHVRLLARIKIGSSPFFSFVRVGRNTKCRVQLLFYLLLLFHMLN